jgi:endonuclease IV
VNLSEEFLVEKLRLVVERNWPVIVHPDVIRNVDLWRGFEEMLCIENMDKRKSIGRTVSELTRIYDKLPNASLCFDIGHARQVDPTMCEADRIMRYHGHRLKQLHVSDVTSQSKHEPLSYGAVLAFRKIANLIPTRIPLILETPVSENQLVVEVARASDALKRIPEQRGTQLV